MSKRGMYTTFLKKSGDKLIHVNSGESLLYQEFVNLLGEGQQVEVFFDAYKDDGTLSQNAKIHACIRELAKEMGTDFETMKKLVKKRAGFYIDVEVEGETIREWKEFSRASKDDLALVIETIIKMGDFLSMNLR